MPSRHVKNKQRPWRRRIERRLTRVEAGIGVLTGAVLLPKVQVGNNTLPSAVEQLLKGLF